MLYPRSRLMVTRLKVTLGASTTESIVTVPFKFKVTPVVGKVDPVLMTKLPATFKVGLAAIVKTAEDEFDKLLIVKVLTFGVVIVPLFVILNKPFQVVKFVPVIVELFTMVPPLPVTVVSEEILNVPLLVKVPPRFIVSVPVPTVIVPSLVRLLAE